MKNTLITLALAITLPLVANGATKAETKNPAFVAWVNTADDGFLLDVKGIGKVKLEAIKNGRPYADREAILTIKGIGKATLQAMRAYFTAIK